MAPAPKDLRWYDTDHEFADVEASFDRMRRLEEQLRFRPVQPLLDRLWTNPEKLAAASPAK